MKSLSEIEKWRDSRETSIEIAVSIFEIAETDEQAQRIWEDPTDEEKNRILKSAFQSSDENTLLWGSSQYTKDDVENMFIDIQYYNGYNLEDESNPFNWYNCGDVDTTSTFWAGELAAANQLMEEYECGTDEYETYQHIVWNMLCD